MGHSAGRPGKLWAGCGMCFSVRVFAACERSWQSVAGILHKCHNQNMLLRESLQCAEVIRSRNRLSSLSSTAPWFGW